MLEPLTRWLRDAAGTPAGSEMREDRGAGPPPRDGDGQLLIDVRSEQEFRSSALEGAVNLPLPQLLAGIRDLALDPATPVVLYCASGARSAAASMALRQMGYTRVSDAGGLFAAAASLKRALRP
jgi:rhodanese-related sulfurtransferase